MLCPLQMGHLALLNGPFSMPNWAVYYFKSFNYVNLILFFQLYNVLIGFFYLNLQNIL